MSYEPSSVLVVLSVFCAMVIRSTFGFGDALIAMPVLTMLVGFDIAGPLIAMLSATVAAIILLKDWRRVDLRSVWKLILSSAVGIPFGLYLVTWSDETVVKLVLATIIIVFATYSLCKPRLPGLKNEKLAVLFGLASGVLGGAYNTVGLPIVVYGTLRGWSAGQFRATIQGVFLPISILIVIGHAMHGRATPLVLSYYLVCLPLMLLALLVGTWLNEWLNREGFVRYVYGMLILIGVMLVFQSLSR